MKRKLLLGKSLLHQAIDCNDLLRISAMITSLFGNSRKSQEKVKKVLVKSQQKCCSVIKKVQRSEGQNIQRCSQSSQFCVKFFENQLISLSFDSNLKKVDMSKKGVNT